jgi:hypothetical protein
MLREGEVSEILIALIILIALPLGYLDKMDNLGKYYGYSVG